MIFFSFWDLFTKVNFLLGQNIKIILLQADQNGYKPFRFLYTETVLKFNEILCETDYIYACARLDYQRERQEITSMAISHKTNTYIIQIYLV